MGSVYFVGSFTCVMSWILTVSTGNVNPNLPRTKSIKWSQHAVPSSKNQCQSVKSMNSRILESACSSRWVLLWAESKRFGTEGEDNSQRHLSLIISMIHWLKKYNNLVQKVAIRGRFTEPATWENRSLDHYSKFTAIMLKTSMKAIETRGVQ